MRLLKTAVMMIFVIANFLFGELVSEINFDTTEVNQKIEQIVTLSNTGDLPLAIYTIQLSTETGSFHLIADSTYTIEGGSEVDIAIEYAPKQAGIHTGALYIESNDEENSKVTLELLGVATSSQTAIDDLTGLPTEFILHQNYPNPFNPSTTVKYDLPKESQVTLTIYNITGQKIATLVNDVQSAGYHEVIWNGANIHGQKVSSGVYFLRMQAGQFIRTISMTFTK